MATITPQIGTITSREAEQVERANASGKTPVVFIHGLRLLPGSWDRWAEVVELDRLEDIHRHDLFPLRLRELPRAAPPACRRHTAEAVTSVPGRTRRPAAGMATT
jgi:hypothetical protein